MTDAREPPVELDATLIAEREWVMLVRDDQIASVLRLDAFFRALARDVIGARPRITPRRALYVLAEPTGVIRAACAFTIAGDTEARRAPSELPLRRLALTAQEGPDLGWGRIQIACAFQCPDPAFASELWGLSPNHIAPSLREAQRILRERLNGRSDNRQRERRGASPGRRAVDHARANAFAEMQAGWRLPADGTLTPEQLERGRRVADQQRAEVAESDADAELRRLEDANRRYRAENDRLRQEIVLLRRLLRAETED